MKTYKKLKKYLKENNIPGNTTREKVEFFIEIALALVTGTLLGYGLQMLVSIIQEICNNQLIF